MSMDLRLFPSNEPEAVDVADSGQLHRSSEIIRPIPVDFERCSLRRRRMQTLTSLFVDVGTNMLHLCRLWSRRPNAGNQAIGRTGLQMSGFATSPSLTMAVTFVWPITRVVAMVMTTRASTGSVRLSRVRQMMAAAIRGLSRIRHPSLTMPGAGGLQSVIITRKAAFRM